MNVLLSDPNLSTRKTSEGKLIVQVRYSGMDVSDRHGYGPANRDGSS